ncbi:MAG: T9SS type A sorting domain-containing protein [Lewinellaceae bacterium]|nr:T9SS type A sorting domain-containing protein [Saprospiraceae bacterium]MCB9338403.1 T9SS type A sorting domain-containing protein [Lewinellaceae bacterium]
MLECIENFNTLRLYKVTSDGDIVSSVKFNQPLEVERYFYPNPFRGKVTLAGPLPEGRADLFAADISGKTYGPVAFSGTNADLGFLPTGQYVLSLRAENGRILFSQLAVKVE